MGTKSNCIIVKNDRRNAIINKFCEWIGVCVCVRVRERSLKVLLKLTITFSHSLSISKRHCQPLNHYVGFALRMNMTQVRQWWCSYSFACSFPMRSRTLLFAAAKLFAQLPGNAYSLVFGFCAFEPRRARTSIGYATAVNGDIRTSMKRPTEHTNALEHGWRTRNNGI